MRPLLFRAYGDWAKQMHYFSIDLVTLEQVWYTNRHCSEIADDRPSAMSTPMQWIGIEDRNGNRIFELDIIERKIRQEGETVGFERGLVVAELWYFAIIRFGLDETYIGERPYPDWRPSCELSVIDEEFFENCTVVENFYEGAALPEHLNTLTNITARTGEAERRFRA